MTNGLVPVRGTGVALYNSWILWECLYLTAILFVIPESFSPGHYMDIITVDMTLWNSTCSDKGSANCRWLTHVQSTGHLGLFEGSLLKSKMLLAWLQLLAVVQWFLPQISVALFLLWRKVSRDVTRLRFRVASWAIFQLLSVLALYLVQSRYVLVELICGCRSWFKQCG